MPAPLDTIETILDASRVRLNDAIASLGGDVLTDNAVFTTQVVNNAWRRFQRRLASLGYMLLEQEAVITGLPAVFSTGTPDPGTQVWLDWTGYWDGSTLDASFVLPDWFIYPLDCWERISGSGGSYFDMDQQTKGLPSVPQQSWNLLWEWRQNRLYMPGSLTVTDLRIRGASLLADFTDLAATDAGDQIVPIVQCLDPFSNYICAEMANSRGDIDAKNFDDKADHGAMMIAARDTQGATRTVKASELSKMPDRLTPAGGPQ